MANVSFMAHGIRLWVEYKAHDYDDIELLSITLDKSETDIEPLLGSDVIELAYKACEIDIIELEEYRKQAAEEILYCEDY